MQMIVDMLLIVLMFVFAYAFGRKSESDNKPIIPSEVTWFTLFFLLIILILLNLPAIFSLISR